MSFWGRLFGSESVVQKAADGIYNGVDALIHTDQEKAEYFLRMLKAYEPFKLAQRFLALIVGIPYVIVWLISAAMFVISVFMEPCMVFPAGAAEAVETICRSNTVQTGAKELARMNNETLGTPFSIILAFYFGGGAVEGVVRHVAERKLK